MGMTATQSEPDAQSVALAAIQEQLERLLCCPSFHNSKRYPKFLKYVVEKGVSGSLEELKERVIGVEVFARPADYEPATDPIVRLVAGETRKRLAQYYLQAEHSEELRIEIPPGSYVPTIYWPQRATTGFREASAQGEEAGATEIAPLPAVHDGLAAKADIALVPYPAGASTSRFRRFRLPLAIAAAIVVLATGLASAAWWVRTAPERQLKTFWAPMLSANPSVLICIGDWASSAPGLKGRRYVGPYDLAAAVRLAGLLSSAGHQFSILMASDSTLTDLRAEPGILVGASNNKWTPMILSNARYQFRTTTGPDADRNFVVDMSAPGNHDSEADAISVPSGTAMGQELALISRVASPATGQVELIVAGTGANGTVAAGEFATNPYYFAQFTDHAPRDWSQHNIQILVSTDVINGRSGPPHMIRFYLY